MLHRPQPANPFDSTGLGQQFFHPFGLRHRGGASGGRDAVIAAPLVVFVHWRPFPAFRDQPICQQPLEDRGQRTVESCSSPWLSASASFRPNDSSTWKTAGLRGSVVCRYKL